MGSSGCWQAAHLAGSAGQNPTGWRIRTIWMRAGQFLVDFQDLPDLAVLAAGDGGSACGS
jgi:hypothetical protein